MVRREKDYSEELRREAIRGLGRTRDPLGVPTLREVLDRDSRLSRRKLRPLRQAAAQSLARIADKEAILALQAYATGGDSAIAKTCSELLRTI